jgi:hypothetical protein
LHSTILTPHPPHPYITPHTQGKFHIHAEISPEKQQELIDNHFLFNGHDKRQAAAGYHNNWPHGRGIYQADDKEFNIWINEGMRLEPFFILDSRHTVSWL